MSMSLAILLATAAGCSKAGESEAGLHGEIDAPSASAARDILQATFDANPECAPFFDLPHDVAPDASYDRLQLQAFVDAGLLVAEGETTVTDPAAGAGHRAVVRYRATQQGLKTFRPGTGELAQQKTVICYGTRKVDDVEVGQLDILGTRVSVTYRYRLGAIPAWARSAAIAARYPSFEKFVSGAKEDHGTLVQSGGAWKLEGPPPSEMYDFRQLGR